MQISVVGGSGFVGSHVVDALLASDHAVRVIDTAPPLQVDVEWRRVDLFDEAALTQALVGSDFVFHLAAMADVNDVLANPVESVAVNALGTVRVLEAARRANTGRVILASSVWVYSATLGQVVDEDSLFDLEADKHIYVSEKLAAEMFCRDYLNLYGRPYTVLRYGIPYGPRMRGDLVVAAFLDRALRGEDLAIDGDGSQERRFVYVEDLAAAHVLALAPRAENRTYNLESTEATSIREIAETVRRLVGDVTVTFGPARPGDYRARVVRSDRARDELGWEPRVSFAQGMVKTLAWYRAQSSTPARPRDTHPAPGRRCIAVVPAYNEQSTVAAVLDELYPRVDEIIVVDDGSTDGTRIEIASWMDGKGNCRLLHHDVNRGMSEAYVLAFADLRERLELGELDPDDLVFTVDADGQHDLAVLDDLARTAVDDHVDAMLARRDLSYHGWFKKLGNLVLSSWATAWSGRRLHDVESGYRVFRLGALAHATDYYSGHRYTETVEVAVVMSRLGYAVRNDYLVPVPVARSRTSIRDAAADFFAIPAAATRVWRADTRMSAARGPGALSITAMVAFLLAITVGHDSPSILAVAALGLPAAVVTGLFVRNFVRGGSLPITGLGVATVAAWLVPQRTDLASSVGLLVLFSVAVSIASEPARVRHLASVSALGAILLAVRFENLRTALLVTAVAVVLVNTALALLRAAPAPAARNARPRRFAFAVLIVTITGITTSYFGASTVSATWFGGGIVHGPRAGNEVAITFDSSTDMTDTPPIMAALIRDHIPATFFVAGAAADQHPRIVRSVYAHGFLVGSEAYHADRWRWMDPRYPELDRSLRSVSNLLGVCPAWYRPPHGRKTPFIAAAVHKHGMGMVFWDVSGGGAKVDDPHQIADRVLRGVRGGSIIDLRVDLEDTSKGASRSALVRSIPIITAGLRARHLQPVRLDELLHGAAYTSCA